MPSIPISESTLERVRRLDLDTISSLDARGIIPGSDEDAGAFADRLAVLNRNYSKMEEELRTSGTYKVEDVKVAARDRIPQSLLKEANAYMEKNLAFCNDWIPGFFLDPAFSLMFGGCAYYFPDFFALFIIRSSFRKKKRWLFYQRQELLAHEICHTARIGLNSNIYEEPFAYRTATTGFRRFFGGIFRSQIDSFAFLGSALLMTAAQIIRLYLLPALPFWPFLALLLGIVAFLLGRHLIVMNRMRTARQNLVRIFGHRADAVLFRCTDEEVTKLAGCSTSEALQDFLSARKDNLRWQVIRHRFPLL